MDNINLVESFSEFKEFKNIDRETMMRILEDVFRTLLVRKYGTDENIDIIVNIDKGDLEIYRNLTIVEDGDLQDEILDGSNIDKWDWVNKKSDRMVTFADYGAASINGTKANPCISADLFGDWREEVIYYNRNDPSQLLIFTTTIPTEHRLYTLMHDPVYRLGIAWQNVVYNQPPHLGFYIGCGLENIPYPYIFTPKAKDVP